LGKPVFLKAEWNNLIMLNYEVDPAILQPYVPAGTELDFWEGKALVSMVGFMFNNTRVLGVKWPFHVNFEEVNLRFYVRYFDGNVWKRGAVFISEIVPKYIIAATANLLYKEHYSRLPMRHAVIPVGSDHTRFLYEWKINGNWNKLGATVSNNFMTIQPGSAEEFIFEHYWGYNSWSSVLTMEYQVEHVSWEIAAVRDCVFEADISTLYGKQFLPYLAVKPVSVFFAKGSAINVRMGEKIRL
jgi:uncharacterized protein YqjF (DUF2071 family)